MNPFIENSQLSQAMYMLQESDVDLLKCYKHSITIKILNTNCRLVDFPEYGQGSVLLNFE